MKWVTAIAVAALTAGAAFGADAFAKKPTATVQGDAVRIEFTLAAPTDVEVAICDGAGAVVRHLNAGAVGKGPPLAQSFTWDRKDDAGRPVKGAGFRVRVRCGLGAAFERIIGWSGQMIDAPRAMACAPDGTLYILHGEKFYGHRQTALISAFDRDGQYLRQVYPGPGDLPKDKRQGWPTVAFDDGSEAPVIHHVLTRSLYPGAFFGEEGIDLTGLAVTGDGKVVAVSGGSAASLIKDPDVRGGRRLLIFGADGSVPANSLGPVLTGLNVGGPGVVAVSPDGKYAYVTGLGAGAKGATTEHVVYRAPLDGGDKAEVFIGKLREPGAGKDRLSDPRGLAVGPEGNLYVADSGNKRIAIFSPAGVYVGEFPAEGVTQLAVHRKTGAVYALAAGSLVKFGGLKDPAKKAELALPKLGADARQMFTFALDDSGAEPVLWANTTFWINYRLVRITDRGDRLEALGDAIGSRLKDQALPYIMDVCPIGDSVITRAPSAPSGSTTAVKYNLLTGACEGDFILKDMKGVREKRDNLFFCGSEFTAGKDGRLYTQTGGWTDIRPTPWVQNPGRIGRFNADGQAAPFETRGTNFVHQFFHGHYRPAGLFVDRDGRMTVAAFPGYRGRDQKEPGLSLYTISPKGEVTEKPRVVVGATVGGIAVDRDGSVYLGVNIWPKDARIPEWFAGKLPANSPAGHPGRMYAQHGMLVKFAPAGGRIVQDPAGPYLGHAGGYAQPAPKDKAAPVRVENAQWMRRIGLIPINDGDEAYCQCENTRFDLDEFGRVFVPDLYRFRVVVFDTNGNEVTHFGGYGNMDNRGPGSPHPMPAIAYGWPIAARLAGERLVVADLTNRRLVVTRMTFAATETCAVP